MGYAPPRGTRGSVRKARRAVFWDMVPSCPSGWDMGSFSGTSEFWQGFPRQLTTVLGDVSCPGCHQRRPRRSALDFDVPKSDDKKISSGLWTRDPRSVGWTIFAVRAERMWTRDQLSVGGVLRPEKAGRMPALPAKVGMVGIGRLVTPSPHFTTDSLPRVCCFICG